MFTVDARHGVRSNVGRSLLVLAVALGLLAVPPSPARALEHDDVPNLETFDLPSDLIDTTTPGGRLARRRTVPRVHVLLPEGYAEHPEREYPVLWLLHGANGGNDTWIPEITEHLPRFPGIIVMPDGGTFGMYTDWWNGGSRGGPAWATYHLEVVRQTIEARYRIRPERRWHAIGGISMGGQGALRYAALLPGYFGSVAAFSAALPDMQAVEAQLGLTILAGAGGHAGITHEAVFGPAAGAYAEGNSARALVDNLAHTRVYLTSGWGLPCTQDPLVLEAVLLDAITETFLHAQQAGFSVALRRAGADVTPITTCGVHTFGVWDRAIPKAREWGFFGDVPEAPSRWAYRTVATSGEMWGLRFRFADPPSQVVRFERVGSRLIGSGSGQVTITGPSGCEVRASLPFHRALPADCLSG